MAVLIGILQIAGVGPALIALQDCRGLDVNLMLFAAWLGLSGRGLLDPVGLAAADRAAAGLRAEIVEPLRGLRRRLKASPDADVQRLRAGVAALELAAEEIVQRRLADLAGPAAATVRNARIAAARANLALYLGSETVGSAAAAAICEALGGFAADC